jgi:ABC-2 type transport system ATP-binding protein
MKAMYRDIVDFAELDRFMDQRLKNYSSGMQVRLAFSIAVRAKSDILLIDEVLAVGDAAFQRKCFDYFMELKKQNKTLILVTHDMAAIRQYCDRAIMIEKGDIVKRGDPETIARAYLELFIKEAMDNTGDSNDELSDSKDRWGNAKLIANKVSSKVTNGTVTLTVRYKSNESLPGPVLGFTIYSPSGLNIIEGNTIRSKIKTPDLKSGETITVEWEIPNIFANGNYEVSVACCDQSTTEFYDWLNKAVSFTINKETTTAGAVDPEIHIANLTKK